MSVKNIVSHFLSRKVGFALLSLLLLAAPGNIVAQAQDRVSGTVKDGNGAPVPGAFVVLKDKQTTGTMSDAEGRFSIEAKTGDVLVVSSLGYKSTEVTVTKAVVDVVIVEDNELLEEVVVTALGVKRSEKALGYSVQKLSSEKLVTSKGTNVATSLTGRIAGLNVQNSTEFFDSPSLLLRGETPRIIIDGVPYTSIGLDQLSADDIESIDVLKGATASALYGSKGSSGAIMITTKKGSQEEGISVSVNSNTMIFSGYLAFPETQNKYSAGSGGRVGYDGYRWGDILDQGKTALLYNPETYEWEDMPLTSKGVDNFKNFLQFSMVTNNSVSVSQRGKFGSFRASMNHIYNRGQYPNQDLNKTNFTIGGEMRYKKFSLEASASYNKHIASNYHGKGYSGSYMYNLVIWGFPQYDVRDFKNYWVAGKENELQNWYDTAWYNNPYFEAYEIVDNFNTDYLNAMVNLSYEITPWLKAVVRGGLDAKSSREEWRNPISASTGAWGANGKYGIERDYTNSINTDAMLMADKKWGKFGIEGLLGGNLYYYSYDYITSETENGINVPGFYSLNASVDKPSTSSGIRRQQINSLYGKATFSWDDTYFIDVTGRNDWSSTLSPENSSYFYPSVAGSAVLSEAFSLPKWWDFLKVRGSWTMTKTPAGIYDISNAYSIYDTWNDWKAATYPSTLKGGSVSPQTAQYWEVGLNSKFFMNRLYVDLALYRKDEYDFIRDGGVSPTTGFSAVQINCSETRRRSGVELVIGGTPVQTKDFRWDIQTNWGHDKYTYQTIDPEYSTKKSWVYEGADWDWITAWDWQRDPDGNLVITQSGYPIWMPVDTKMGKTTPDLVWGIGNTFKYKNWTLSFSFDGRIGGVMWNQTHQAIVHSGASIITDTQDRYNEVVNGEVTFCPKGVNVVDGKVAYDSSGNVIEDTRTFKPNDVKVSYESYMMYYYGQRSSAYIQCMMDATFIKLRDFSITYDIPTNVCEKIKMKGASVGVTGQNVFLWTKEFRDADPDVGTDDINSPSQRYLGFNIKLNF